MRCNNCYSEWNEINNKFYVFCPFCQEPLIYISEKFKTLEEALMYLSREYGCEILDDKQTVLRFMDVFLPEKRRERNFLNMAYTSGIIDSILLARDDSAKRQQMFVQQAVNQLQNEFGVSNDWADYIINCIASCLGIRFQSNNSAVKRRISAENGDSKAQLFLAIEALDNEDLESYIHWICMAMENGSMEAMFHYGKYLHRQSENELEGIQFLINSAECGNVDAACYMARYISTLSGENLNKITKIVGEINTKYKLLSTQQLIDLTFYYEQIQDFNKAIELAELAYIKEPTNTWLRYSELLKKRSNDADYMTVGKIYREEIKNGNVMAIELLAEYIEERATSSISMKTALHWYKVAADAGSVLSQLRLAKAYEMGDLVSKDISKAIEWYEMAAINGSNEAYQKISLKSPYCIRKTVKLLLEDDSVLECDIEGIFSYQGNDYLMIIAPDFHESIPLEFREIGLAGDFEVNLLDEKEEEEVLNAFQKNR